MPDDIDAALAALEEERQLAMGSEARLYSALSLAQLGEPLVRSSDEYTCAVCGETIPTHLPLTVAWVERTTLDETGAPYPAGIEYMGVADAAHATDIIDLSEARAGALHEGTPTELGYEALVLTLPPEGE